jgi:hypothetical protein
LTLSALGFTMSSLASAYSALGRHQDALVMGEKALELRRRVLPKNHLSTCISCLNVGVSYFKLGDLHRALPFAREALRMLQATLPPSHPHVKQAQQLVLHCESDAARRL